MGFQTNGTTDVGFLDRMLALRLQTGKFLAEPLSIDTQAMHTSMGFGPDLVIGHQLIVVRKAVDIDGCRFRLGAFIGAQPTAAVALDALALPIDDTALFVLRCDRLWLRSALVATATGAGLLVARGQFE